MTELGPEDVKRIARLAALELPKEERDGAWVEVDRLIDDHSLEKLSAELGSILAHVEQLDELDVSNVPITTHGVPLPTLFRDDAADFEHIETEAALSGAPAREGDSFVVPRIIE